MSFEDDNQAYYSYRYKTKSGIDKIVQIDKKTVHRLDSNEELNRIIARLAEDEGE